MLFAQPSIRLVVGILVGEECTRKPVEFALVRTGCEDKRFDGTVKAGGVTETSRHEGFLRTYSRSGREAFDGAASQDLSQSGQGGYRRH